MPMTWLYLPDNRPNMELKKLSSGDLEDLKALIRLYAEVFDQVFAIPEDAYLKDLLKKEHLIFYVASSGGHLLGGLTAHVLPSLYTPSSEVYLYDLAVDKRYQRQGVGTALIAALKKYCDSIGYKEIFVQADAGDEQALNFYKKTGGVRTPVFHFSYPLGQELPAQGITT
jgi:aminoglycoside 3-N-acetyltransferase I